MSEFGGLWKHQTNPACTKSVSLRNVEVGHYTEEEEECSTGCRMDGLLLGQVVTDVSISDQTAGTAVLLLARVVTDASVLKRDLNT